MERESRPKIYLIANNLNPEPGVLKFVKKNQLKPDDLVVVFNMASSPVIDFFDRVDIACFRSHVGGSEYFGVENESLKIIPRLRQVSKFFFLSNGLDKTLPKIVSVNDLEGKYEKHSVTENEAHDLIYKDVKTSFSEGMGPSTGFYYVHYFLENFPEHLIYLIGFETISKSEWHPFEAEKKAIKKFCEMSCLVNK